jgi:hypothetical protein
MRLRACCQVLRKQLCRRRHTWMSVVERHVCAHGADGCSADAHLGPLGPQPVCFIAVVCCVPGLLGSVRAVCGLCFPVGHATAACFCALCDLLISWLSLAFCLSVLEVVCFVSRGVCSQSPPAKKLQCAGCAERTGPAHARVFIGGPLLGWRVWRTVGGCLFKLTHHSVIFLVLFTGVGICADCACAAVCSACRPVHVLALLLVPIVHLMSAGCRCAEWGVLCTCSGMLCSGMLCYAVQWHAVLSCGLLSLLGSCRTGSSEHAG